jgi:hypothetical protein
MAPNVRHNNFSANPLEIDPDVQIPEAVKRAAAAADAAQRRATGQPDPEPEPPATPPGNEPEPPAPPPATPPKAAEPPAPPSPPDDASWENKYKSMKGHFDRANAMNRQLVDQVDNLRQLIETMQTAPPAPAATPLAVAENLITDKEREEFGPEMLDLIGRRALEVVGQQTKPLLEEIARLKGQVGTTQQVVTKNARERMHEDLTRDMPEWKEVNNLDEFKAWLALPDPYSGVIRHSTLLAAYEQNDTPRVLAFFKGFRSELAAVDPAPSLPAPPVTPAAPRPKLADFAAPGRAGATGAAPAPEEKPVITHGQIREFYANVRKGMYSPEEQAQHERMIFAAQREGRVL